MEHLNAETLARLVDETPEPDEARHLARCDACADELTALREQTEQLGTLPELMPPGGDWTVLEARLRSEGLMEDRGLMDRLGLARTPTWMRAAAAVLLFMSGTGVGAALASGGGLDAEGPTSVAADAATVQDAASAVRMAERQYMDALVRYQSMTGQGVPEERMADRFAALEYLVAAGQAAVRQAPADPFFNGLLASTMAERDAVVRQITSRQDGWF